MTFASPTPMSLEIGPDSLTSSSPIVEHNSAAAPAVALADAHALLNTVPSPDVLNRILAAIQLGSPDPLAHYVRSYRMPPNGALPALLASLLRADPMLELLWVGPPSLDGPPIFPSHSEHFAASKQHAIAAQQGNGVIHKLVDQKSIVLPPMQMPLGFDSSLSSSSAPGSASSTSPPGPLLPQPSLQQGRTISLIPILPPLAGMGVKNDTDVAATAWQQASDQSAQGASRTYSKPKKDVEVVTAKQQQRDRIEQLIYQFLQLCETPDSPHITPAVHHLFAEASIQKQNRVLHKLPQETFAKLLKQLTANIMHASELAKERTVDTTLGLDSALVLLVLMTAEALPGAVYAEEHLELITRLVRDHLGCHVFPVLDPSLAAATQRKDKDSEVSTTSGSDDEEIVVKKRTTKKRAPGLAPKGLSAICNKLTQVLESVQMFIADRNVTDSIILDLTSSCLGVLFLEPLASIHAALNSLQLSALNVARTIYSRYHVHRDNMLTDVFSHMLRLPTASRTLRSYILPEDDRKIQTISALVMQLLQASTLLPGMAVRKTLDLDVADNGSLSSYATASHTAAQFMTSCLHKCIVKSEETDAKGVLFNLVADLLSVVSLPEWPAAALLLQSLVSASLHVLRQPSQDPKKEGKENKETVAMKVVAIDLFREIAPVYKQLIISSQGNSPFRPVDVRGKDEDKVDCVCGVDRGTAETREMICCSTCNRWYHAVCVSVNAQVFAGAADWFCDDCLFAKQMATDPSALYSAAVPLKPLKPEPAPSASDLNISENEDEKKKGDEKSEMEEMGETAKKSTGSRGGMGKKTTTALKKVAGGKRKEAPAAGEEDLAAKAAREKGEVELKRKQEEEEAVEIKRRATPTLEQLEQYKLVQLLLNYLLPRQADDPNALYARRFLLCQFVADSDDDEYTLAYCMGQWHLVPLPTHARLSRPGTARILLRLLVAKHLSKGFDAMLLAVANSLMDGNQLLRSKGIRTLTAIVQVDSSILVLDRVRQTVQDRTQDISKVVREATVDLVGKYIHSAPHLTTHYFDTIAKRITDAGVLVRRKAVSILVEILRNQPDSTRVSEICSLLVGRVNDKDESIKKLVSQSFMDLWFKENSTAQQLQQRVGQIVPTVANAKNAPWFSSLLIKLLGKREDKKQQHLAVTCQKMCEILFNRLLAHEAARASADKTSPKFADETKAMTDTVWTLSVFCKAAPQFLLPHVTHLSYYLATTVALPKGPHEPRVVELVAGMVSQVLPLLQNPSADSVKTLEENLSRLVCQQAMSVVPACVKCLGVLVSSVSENSALMVELYNRFFSTLVKAKNAPKLDKGAVVRALFTLPLLVKDYDFETKAGLKGIEDQLFPLFEHYSEAFPGEPQIPVTAIQGLGSLFIAFPNHLPISGEFIRKTLSSNNPPLRIHMCRALLATLQHSADSILATAAADALEDTSTWISPTGHDATGAVAEHAEKVVALLFDPLDDVRNESLSLVTVMLKQGLIHPMQCIARLIALNADQRPALAMRAYHVLAQLDDRYPDMIWNRLLDGIRGSFSLQRAAFNSALAVKLEGKEMHSVWERVYLLPKKQSAQRIERSQFLASLVKYFDLPDNAKVLAYLPYRIPEDPLSVVYHINKLLAMRGETLLSQVKEGKEKQVSQSLADQCGNMSLLIVLKNFLKVLYCLSESKCRAYMPNAGAAAGAENKERKEKLLVPRTEVLERSSPFPNVIVGELAEKFRALMKSDSGDNLVGVQAPLHKQKRTRKPKEKKEKDDDSSEGETRVKKALGKKAPRKKRVRVTAEDDDEEDAVESADEYQPQK